MDIRKYFGGGGGGGKPLVKKTAGSTSTNSSKIKSPATKTSSKNVVQKVNKSEVVIIDSDSNDSSFREKKRNNSKSKDKQKGTPTKKKESRSETKSKEASLNSKSESPGEKENKEQETKAERSKKEEKPKKEDKLKKDDRGRKEELVEPQIAKEPKRKESEKKGRKKSAEEGKNKRKSSSKTDSDDEELQAKAKPTKGKGRKVTRIFDSDSDEEDPLPPSTKNSSKKQKRTLNFVPDSDDDDKQLSIQAAFSKVAPKKNSPRKVAAAPVKPLKACSAADFFGSPGPVHRVERKMAPIKRKAESSQDPDDFRDDDMEIHDDEEFEKTLLQLDAQQHTPKKIKLDKEASSSTSKSSSLASKLAAKVKKEDTIVFETPEKKSPRKPSPVSLKEEKIIEKMSPKKPSPKKVSPKKSEEENNSAKDGPSYKSYLQRAGPQALGSKEVPEGESNCLEGMTFVLTGVYESIERDECKALVERLGGKVTTSLSKKTNYIVVGRDAGVSKTAKAQELKTKQLDEDGLFDLIRNAKGKKSKYEIAAEEAAKKEKPRNPKPSPQISRKPLISQSPATPSSSHKSQRHVSNSSPAISSPKPGQADEESSLMWVDKHKPKSLKQIIGQQGAKSNANKLSYWLKNWHKWVAEGRKPAFNARFGNDDGAGCRAALLSGPPGVGKTTTATLVCQELGFSYVELNASDTRSKKSLETEVAELLGNHTLVDFFGGAPKSQRPQDSSGHNHCLIMDEVDGMSGNADRGGMQELIQLIKKSKIPIICMCNDRNHQKIRSLANHCFDLRFQRPRVEQIKAAMMSLAFKEGVKIPPPALNEMISAANQDVRQVIHNLSMWTAANKAPTYDQIKKDAAKSAKDMKMGPFDVCRKVFVGGEETAKMTIHDKSDLFFQDYSFGPLFVHENYLHAMPNRAQGDKKKHLRCVSQAIDSISDGDMIDKIIRRSQNWSLLPTEAMFASVIPGDTMRGGFRTMVQFPQWLGKHSSTGKTERILQELSMHMSLKVSADKRSLNLDYLPFLRTALTKPLSESQQEGVPDVLEVLNEYSLLKEDYDNILEVSQWSNRKDPLANVESKTKAAFTRAYNKEGHLQPYAASVAAKKGRGRGGGGGEDPYGEDAEEGGEEEGGNDEDPTKDAMIKPKKRTGKAASGGQSSKGKGGGKGRGQTAGSSRGSGGRGRGRGKKN